jgi:hypothetical protein
MAIRKQEFYEGAALHFFILNQHLFVLLKYSTRGRSPWGFTFTPGEQASLKSRAARSAVVIGLICGSDGIAAFSYDAYRTIASPRESAVHVACYRDHSRHYEVNGPDGELDEKVPPSAWRYLLDR